MHVLVYRMTHPQSLAQTGFFRNFYVMLFIVTVWLAVFYFFSPETFIDYIGIEYAYVVIFLIALVCGFSSVTGSAFYVAIVTLSTHGANTLLLGLAGGVGLALSDGLFFYVLTVGVKHLDTSKSWLIQKIRLVVHAVPSWALGMSIYIYCALSPIPNDVMLAALACSGIHGRSIAPYVFLGDISSALLWAYIGT